MRIQHNIMAMNAYRNYNNNTSALSQNLEKLSSGYKINRAGDDAAGLAISEKMRAQITGLEQAQDNAQSGINLVQTAEGALQEVHDMLNRMVKLADQSANGTYDDPVDRANLQQEVDALLEEINRISESANYNGIQLLDGSLDGGSPGTSTVTFTGTETNGSAALNMILSGVPTNVTINGASNVAVNITFTEGSTGNAAVMSTGGTITVTLNGDNDTSASAIATLIQNADLTAITDTEEQTAIRNALAKVTATGTGLTAATGGTATGIVNTTGTAAADTATGKPLTLQIGDTSDPFNQMEVSIGAMDAASLGIATISVARQSAAQDAVDVIKAAINEVSKTRGILGATQNRLDHTINNLSVMTENIQDAESTIRDTDVAEEMMAYTKNNILVQSAQAMLAQANQVPQGVLQLLQ